MTQKQRVLRALERQQGLGVKTTDFDAGQVIDGGKPIRRLAARIGELRDEGYTIRSTTRNGICTYTLIPRTEPFAGSVLTTPLTGNSEVVATSENGAEWSTESPAIAAPVSGRALESLSEDYIEEGELSWV